MGNVNIWQLVTMILPLMAQAQEAFSGKPGSGLAKKAFVMNIVTATLTALGPSVTISPERKASIEAAVSSLVDTIASAVKAAEDKAGG